MTLKWKQREKGREIMKHKSNVAAGKSLIIVLSLVAFHFYSLILHSSLRGGKKSNKNIEPL